MPFPVASSKVRSLTSFFSFGIFALASSSLSAALSDLLIYFSSSGVARSSSVNCSREVRARLSASACAFLAAFLLAFRVCAPSICSKTRSAVPVSRSGSVPGAWGRGGALGEMSGAVLPGMGCAACASCAACCSGVFCKTASRARLLIRFFVPLVSFTSIAPSRVIFCMILSRALYCFMVVHLRSAPGRGRKVANGCFL